jgi:hypothetical protein
MALRSPESIRNSATGQSHQRRRSSRRCPSSHPETRAGIQTLPVETGSPIPSGMTGWRNRHAPGRSLACRRCSRHGRLMRLPWHSPLASAFQQIKTQHSAVRGDQAIVKRKRSKVGSACFHSASVRSGGYREVIALASGQPANPPDWRHPPPLGSTLLPLEPRRGFTAPPRRRAHRIRCGAPSWALSLARAGRQ